MADKIKSIKGFEILNAKGNPTVEVELVTQNGKETVASVPAGTSVGSNEAYVLLDKELRFEGKGVRKAVKNVNEIIAPELIGKKLDNIYELDELMLSLDGTENKSNLGANAILPVSVACAKAIAKVQNKNVYEVLTDNKEYKLPNIIATVIAGGEFGLSGLEFEDYLYIFHEFDSFESQLEALIKMRKKLELVLVDKYGQFPEDGGALAAPIESTNEAFETMLSVAEELGYRNKVGLGLDVAASELLDDEINKYKVGSGFLTREELAIYYKNLCDKYPLEYLEDGFDENDIKGFNLIKFFKKQGLQNVGDDLFTSNIKRLELYHDCANGLLLKVNQIGTVSEAVKAAAYAKSNGLDVTVSLRSGETTDDFIADLAVAVGARQIKLGSPVRLERNTKYNRLLKIAAELRH